MSQAGQNNSAAGPVPPTVPEAFVTDVNSPAIPIGNVLDVFGGQITTNNVNGVQTDGSSGSNVLTIQLTNRLSNTLTTANNTPTSITTFSLGAIPGVYTFDINICAFDVTDVLGIGYSIFGTVRTDGATATICGTPDKIVNEETGTNAADANLSASGNNILVQVTGITGKTIHWYSLSTYIFVS